MICMGAPGSRGRGGGKVNGSLTCWVETGWRVQSNVAVAIWPTSRVLPGATPSLFGLNGCHARSLSSSCLRLPGPSSAGRAVARCQTTCRLHGAAAPTAAGPRTAWGRGWDCHHRHPALGTHRFTATTRCGVGGQACRPGATTSWQGHKARAPLGRCVVGLVGGSVGRGRVVTGRTQCRGVGVQGARLGRGHWEAV